MKGGSPSARSSIFPLVFIHIVSLLCTSIVLHIPGVKLFRSIKVDTPYPSTTPNESRSEPEIFAEYPETVFIHPTADSCRSIFGNNVHFGKGVKFVNNRAGHVKVTGNVFKGHIRRQRFSS